MHCGFEHLIGVVPETRLSVAELIQDAGGDATMLEATLENGLREVPVAIGKTTATLAAEAVAQLLADRPDLRVRVAVVILAHSLPVPVPPDTDLLAPIMLAIGRESLPALAVTGQPCAILHGAVQMARTWLSGIHPGGGVLVIGADVPSQPDERLFFNSAMGDAAVAGLLTCDAVRHQIIASTSDTQVVAYSGALSFPDAVARFRKSNPAAIRSSIERCLNAAGIDIGDVRLVVPHTPNRQLWSAVADIMRLPRERFYTDPIAQTGHMNSNDSFVHYLRAIEEARLASGDLALLVNPGFGGTRGCTIMRV
ncbi:3-oxoacyl-[acyl-carrier-protein] synthase III C-terminal domain-containing protein [Marichromatium gracile]|uniref:3-oxoacyl-[acyl-carrier-protein] synthase-3 n=1 Tax=Marichromatium gracile TaxID=1048 RepID=A0A4V6P4P8_MARGR|nr:3-oxoacyl-[acyl-carrier-protein] synthase III C-terminal domain-containing protein [Marichromatium gracile]MBK1710399.1 hypothetical protein [Marichromatium gracile]TCW34570.1 3-oxoacyl-[acyl-carrier-protein] synthase-3 [Marichromatium gracile]